MKACLKEATIVETVLNIKIGFDDVSLCYLHPTSHTKYTSTEHTHQQKKSLCLKMECHICNVSYCSCLLCVCLRKKGGGETPQPANLPKYSFAKTSPPAEMYSILIYTSCIRHTFLCFKNKNVMSAFVKMCTHSKKLNL